MIVQNNLQRHAVLHSVQRSEVWMARKKRYGQISRNYRNMPITHRNNIPHDDANVLQHEPLPPLEHGGIYEEMGADFTYEEMRAQKLAPRGISYFDTSEQKMNVIGWYSGILALVTAIFSLFVWPFWTGLSALAISVVSYNQGTKTLAWISGSIAVIAMVSSIMKYFIAL